MAIKKSMARNFLLLKYHAFVAIHPLIAVTFSTPTSFIIHYLGWQASNMFWGHLSEMLLYRASEATTFVNTCRLVVTKGRKFLWLSGRNRCNIFDALKNSQCWL